MDSTITIYNSPVYGGRPVTVTYKNGPVTTFEGRPVVEGTHEGIVRHDDGREMVRVNVKPGHVIKEIDGIYLDNIVKIEMIQP